MSFTATVMGVLAITAQIGVPLHAGSGRDAEPLGTVLPGVEAPAPAMAVSAPPSWMAVEPGDGARDDLRGAPFADRLGAADYAWIQATLDRLTLREKVAQLVVAYLEGGEPEEGSARWERARRLTKEEHVGGFIVGVGSSYGTASWLNRLQAWSDVPLLVAADLEWGPGTRLKGATVLPMNMALAAAGPASVAYDAGRITALEARAAGVHMAFAPVADVNINPRNPVINTRSYGSDPAAVAARVVAFVEGARSAGLMTVVKHFPGHGDTETDSHLALPVLSVDRFRLESVELTPFRAAIRAGVDGVMTGHLAVPALDPRPKPRPATLSPPILTDLLRGELGFRGLVITDALHMDGVKRQGGAGTVAVAAIRAGADILLIPPDEDRAIDAVVRAVRRGTIPESRIDRSVERVLAAKAVAGLNRRRQVNLGGLLAQIGRGDHEAWGRQEAERSITLVRGTARSLPVRVADRTVMLAIYDDHADEDTGAELESALAQRGARVLALRLSNRSDSTDFARARRLAAAADLSIFASFSRSLPWKGSLGLPEDVAALADELSRRGVPVVSFGDPYLLRQLPDARTYLLAWSNAVVSQRAAVRALVGEIPITGRLPIDLPPDYREGEGLVLPSLPGITTLR